MLKVVLITLKRCMSIFKKTHAYKPKISEGKYPFDTVPEMQIQKYINIVYGYDLSDFKQIVFNNNGLYK